MAFKIRTLAPRINLSEACSRLVLEIGGLPTAHADCDGNAGFSVRGQFTRVCDCPCHPWN